jgi:hypothetical protein
MSTFDLTSTPPPETLLEGLPRRATLTLPELRHAATLAGRAPLPFDITEAATTGGLDDRMGGVPTSADDAAYHAAIGSLHEPADSLARRGLAADGTLDAGVAGALGVLATPRVAVEIDVRIGEVQAKSWQRAVAGAVSSLSTVDGIVFDLAWFDPRQWPLELARVAVLPEDVTAQTSQVPDLLDVPFDLLNAVGEALAHGRPELVPVLAAHHSGEVIDGDGRPLADAEVVAILTAFFAEARGRLRLLATQVADQPRVPVGVVSWVLLADRWRTLRPHRDDDQSRVEIRGVDAADLAAAAAPVLATVTR